MIKRYCIMKFKKNRKKTTMLKLTVWDDANIVYWFQNTSWQRLFLNLEPGYLCHVLGDLFLNWMIFSLNIYLLSLQIDTSTI